LLIGCGEGDFCDGGKSRRSQGHSSATDGAFFNARSQGHELDAD
jgi:hypothetical protein